MHNNAHNYVINCISIVNLQLSIVDCHDKCQSPIVNSINAANAMGEQGDICSVCLELEMGAWLRDLTRREQHELMLLMI